MKTAIQIHEEIEKKAEENAVQEVRKFPEMVVGQVVRQGDIYIHMVDSGHACGEAAKTRQLAIGNTQGSRHVAEEPAKVFEGTTLPSWCARGTFLGPLVKSKRAFKISHPEHAHVELPCGTYQITHQMDARTLDRVKD